MLTAELTGQKGKNNLVVNNYGIFWISILNVKLNFAVETKQIVLAFRVSNIDYCVKSFSVISGVTKPRIIFF